MQNALLLHLRLYVVICVCILQNKHTCEFASNLLIKMFGGFV